jgi:hypothetical protein
MYCSLGITNYSVLIICKNWCLTNGETLQGNNSTRLLYPVFCFCKYCSIGTWCQHWNCYFSFFVHRDCSWSRIFNGGTPGILCFSRITIVSSAATCSNYATRCLYWLGLWCWWRWVIDQENKHMVLLCTLMKIFARMFLLIVKPNVCIQPHDNTTVTFYRSDVSHTYAWLWLLVNNTMAE